METHRMRLPVAWLVLALLKLEMNIITSNKFYNLSNVHLYKLPCCNGLGPNGDPQYEIACGMISFEPASVWNGHNDFEQILQAAERTSLLIHICYDELGPNRDPQDEIACGMISFGPTEIGNGHNHFKQIL